MGLEGIWQATVVTLVPEMFPGPLGHSLVGKGLSAHKWALDVVNLRDYATDKHRSVDDEGYGGGPGMVIKPDVVDSALKSIEHQSGPLLYLSPRGVPLTQEKMQKLASGPGVKLLCGRFEGVDERVLEAHQIEEVSIGDYVLSGGDLAAMVLIDACVRLLPGVLGAEESLSEESFSSGLLEYPHYTRPRTWQGREVPEVLTSGHHHNIQEWRLRKSREITQARRPDLWESYVQTQALCEGSTGKGKN